MEPLPKPPALPSGTSAEEEPDSEREFADRNADTFPLVRQLFEAPRARLAPHANGAKTFVEQSLVCADMIATGAWEGRASVRWLSALWDLSADAVRERHRAGAVAAQADRGAIEAERQNGIGALQKQEQMALDAYENSLVAGNEEDGTLGVGDARLLTAATNARKEILRVAGCMPQPGAFNVNVYQSPQFIEAQGRIVDSFNAALDVDTIAAKLPDIDRAIVDRVLAAARALAEDKMVSLSGPPIIEGHGEAA